MRIIVTVSVDPKLLLLLLRYPIWISICEFLKIDFIGFSN